MSRTVQHPPRIDPDAAALLLASETNTPRSFEGGAASLGFQPPPRPPGVQENFTHTIVNCVSRDHILYARVLLRRTPDGTAARMDVVEQILDVYHRADISGARAWKGARGNVETLLGFGHRHDLNRI